MRKLLLFLIDSMPRNEHPATKDASVDFGAQLQQVCLSPPVDSLFSPCGSIFP